MFVVAALAASAAQARDMALKQLVDRCGEQRRIAASGAYRACPKNVKDRRYRGCIRDADAKSEQAFNSCMSTTTRGACVAKEFGVTRYGAQGQANRFCALVDCGFNELEVSNLGGWVRTSVMSCQSSPPASTPPPAPSPPPAASKPSDGTSGTCSVSKQFHSGGWSCADLRGQVGAFNAYGVPHSERICNSSQIDAVIRANNPSTCANLVEQGEAILKPYRAFDMGTCVPLKGLSPGGWQCSALDGITSQFEEYGVPLSERICSPEQARALKARNDRTNCSNVMSQASAVILKYRKAAAAAEAEKNRVPMGDCKPDPWVPNGGWDCGALKGQDADFEAYKVPASERVCTVQQRDALIAANDRLACSNVVERRLAVVARYKKAATAGDAKPKVDMGTCKPNPKIPSGGWMCSALKGQASQFEAYNVPLGERACTEEQTAALIAANDRLACSNVVEQGEAVLRKYRQIEADAAKALAAAKAAAAKAEEAAKPKPLQWATLPGAAVDIGAGGNGEVWITNAGDQIFRWQGSAWSNVPGSAVRVGVEGNGTAWVVNRAGGIYRFQGGWRHMPGGLADIGVGNGGVVWGVNAGGHIYRHVGGGGWSGAPGAASRVAVDGNGVAWVVNSAGQVYSWQGGNWVHRPGVAARDVAGCGTGDTYVVGTDGAPYRWSGAGWDMLEGERLTNIACDGYGRLYATTESRNILRGPPVSGAPPSPAPTPTPTKTATAPAAKPADPMGSCKPVAGIDSKGWDCRQVMTAFPEYERYGVPASEQVCTRKQAEALVAAKNDANCGNVVVQVGKVLDKYRAAAAAANAMTIDSARYGNNCANAKNTDVTAKVKTACDGKDKCAYRVNVGVLGDPASGCAKSFEAKYTCPGKSQRTMSLSAEAHNKTASFDCSK